MRPKLLFLAILTSLLTLAQPYRIKRIGMEDGLSSNYVTSIAEDKRGCIWIATEEGLNVLHGSTLHTYYKNKGGRTTITGNELNCLLDDPQQPIVWIGTQRDGLCAYDYEANVFRHYRHDGEDPHSLATDDITQLSPTGDRKSIWICTYWGGIDRLDKTTGHFEHLTVETVKGLPSNQTWCSFDDGEGHLYVGHVGSGLSIIDLKTRSARNLAHDPADGNSISGNNVHCIFRDSKHRLWVGTDRGLDRLDLQTMQFIHYTDNGRLSRRIFAIHESGDGSICAANELGGIVRVKTEGGQTTYKYLTEGNGPASLSGQSVRCLQKDRWGNVWMGLYGSGVNFLTYLAPPFSRIDNLPSDPQHSLKGKSALAVCKDDGGRLWVGIDGKGVNVFDAERRFVQEVSELSGRSVQAITKDRQGSLWFGCFNDDVYVIRKGQSQPVHIFKTHPEDTRSFYEMPEGEMWISTSNGIYTVDISTLQVRSHYHDLPNLLTRSMTIDQRGLRWVGTFGGGLYICSPDMKVLKTIDNSQGFPSNTINQIVHSRNGDILVATSEGLAVFKDTTDYKVYGWESGLNNLHIRAVAEDQDGNIWVSTNKGISCKRADDTSGQFLNYSGYDNVPSANFNIASTGTSDDHKWLYFGSTDGLSYFCPEKVLAKRESPQIDFIGVSLTETDSVIPIRQGQEVSLRYDENTFTVLFGATNYALLNATEYQYEIDGLGTSWTIVEEGEITLRNLRPGHYVLKLRSRIRNQQWSETPISLGIRIRPPFWQTWWAYLLYVLLLGSLAYFIYQFYRNQIHLRNLQEQWNRMSQAVNTENQSMEVERTKKKQLLQASLNELDQQFLNRINQLIEQRMDSDIDISYLAEGMNVSQSTLYRKMKSLTGISTNEYVRRYKMHFAERLLLEGKYNISEVGYMVGMSTVAYFRKCFKEEFGENPSDYIKRIKE